MDYDNLFPPFFEHVSNNIYIIYKRPIATIFLCELKSLAVWGRMGKELFGDFFFLRLGIFFWIPVWEGFPFIFLCFALGFP